MSTENDPPEAGPYDSSDAPSAETGAGELESGTPRRESRAVERDRRATRRERRAAQRRARTSEREPPGDEPYEQAPVGEPAGQRRSDNMLPQRPRRPLVLERLLVRLIATGGVIAVGVAIAAIMVSSHSQGWIVGLVVSIVAVVLSAILWSSRQL